MTTLSVLLHIMVSHRVLALFSGWITLSFSHEHLSFVRRAFCCNSQQRKAYRVALFFVFHIRMSTCGAPSANWISKLHSPTNALFNACFVDILYLFCSKHHYKNLQILDKIMCIVHTWCEMLPRGQRLLLCRSTNDRARLFDEQIRHTKRVQ